MRQNLSEPPLRRQSVSAALGLLVLCAGACAPAQAPDGTVEGAPAADARADGTSTVSDSSPERQLEAPAFALGVEVLLRDSMALVRGRRVGLITNHTGLSWPAGAEQGVATIDRLAREPGIDLVALYSPEHGIRGRAEAGQKVASGTDPETGLPIHSLYGETREPTPAMLEGVDVLVFDIQDIGARYYTYVWTMALAMKAAGEQGIPFVVLDRPNPLGGRRVQGNVLDPAYATFVGLHPVPMRHGLTVGELARVLVGVFGIDVDLSVVPMEGWSRDHWYDATPLPFVPPSPNMPSLASATHYPGTCLFEGTNLSVGRGTDRAFQIIGAPWLDADTIARRLNARVAGAGPAGMEDEATLDEAALRGVRFRAVTFTPEAPGDGKFGGEAVRGIRFVVADRERYDPARAAVAALVEIQRLHGDRLEWRVAHFDRLAGTDRLRTGIVEGADLEALTRSWPRETAAFEAVRSPYLLYE